MKISVSGTNVGPPNSRPLVLRLLHSERLKLTTTKTWWQFGIAIVVTTGLALVLSVGTTDDALRHGGKGAPPNGFADLSQAPADLVARFAANIFTSGQFFGGLIALLLGILVMTNEFHYQTATTTFLAAPRRTAVIVSKFLTAAMAGAACWLVATIIDLAVGTYYFSSQGITSQLDSWTVDRAILVNLLVFGLWGVFGLGLGTLLRSQTGATVTATVVYLLGTYGALAVFALIRTYVYHHDSVVKGLVLYPAYAAQIAAAPATAVLPDGAQVAWWIGVIVMMGYGTVMTTIGALLLRRRDIG